MTKAQQQEIDMKRLEKEILSNSAVAALPHNLSDEWLTLLLRDLTDSLDPPDEPSIQRTKPALTAPVAVVSHIVMDKQQTNYLTIPVDDLYTCCNLYRLELEAELMRRQTGMSVIPATLETIFTNRDFIAGN